MSLQKRVEDKLALWQLIHDCDGEITPQLETWLKEVDTQIATKIDSYVYFLDDISSEATRLQEEARALSDASRSLDRVYEALKDRIKQSMMVLGENELGGQKWRFKLVRSMNGPIEVDPSLVPKKYEKTTIVKELDRKQIKADLLAGEDVPGATLTESVQLRNYVNKGAKK